MNAAPLDSKGKRAESSTWLDSISESLQAEQASRVITRTTGFAIAGGFSGAAIAAYQYAPAIPAAFQSAVSTGSTALGFFAFREYLVSPTFLHLQRTGVLEPSSATSPHFKGIAESTTAGAATGAILGGYHFGRTRRIASGGLTFGIIAALGQLGFNEINLARIRYIQRRQGYPPTSPSSPSQDSIDAPSDGGDVSTASPSAPVPTKAPFIQRFTETLLSFTPIRKVSDEEYTSTLRVKLRSAKEELEVVEAQIEDAQRDLEAWRSKRV